MVGIWWECVGNMVLFLNSGEYGGNMWGIWWELERGTKEWERGTKEWERRMSVKKWGILCKRKKEEKYFLLLKLLRILKNIFLTIYAVVPNSIFP